MSSLADAPVAPALPASDIDRARAFYEQTLELTVVEENPGDVTFACGDGTTLFVYPSEFAGTNKATAAGFRVADLDTVMARLRDRGVVFEDYDLPGLKTVDGVATFGDAKGCFFKDTEGNILALVQGG
jgi:catechol 2,3-dioxygenase-like lactoylglutathione lyase family enzyme